MTASPLATAWLAARQHKLAAYHPLVRDEVAAEINLRAGIVAERGGDSIPWQAEGPNADLPMCVNRVVGRLRQAMYGRAGPTTMEALKAQREAACRAAGMTVEGRNVKGEAT